MLVEQLNQYSGEIQVIETYDLDLTDYEQVVNITAQCGDIIEQLTEEECYGY